MNIFKSQLLRAISILNGIELLFSRNSRRCYILGLETSCDDTGASVISQDGIVVSEKVQSQTKFSVLFGGVLPAVARELHQRSITQLTESVMREAGLTWTNLDAVAVTVKPGMPLSLKVGVSYAKEIAQKYTLPIIPIHHMEAHALTAQLIDPGLQFPFLVLLLSGGHGLLALARGLEDFVLLGTALDASPGDVLDKIARRLKLNRIGDPRLNAVSGGRAIEILSAECSHSPLAFDLPCPRSQKRDCDFSFTGIHIAAERLIDRLEVEHAAISGKRDSALLPRDLVANICAAVQLSITQLVCRRVQRAIELTAAHSNLSAWASLTPPTKLVVSGGVAANAFIRQGLTETAAMYGLPLVAPPPHLCTDNGVMVAWNGLLLFRAGSRIIRDPSKIDFEPRAPFGIDCRALVQEANLKIKPIRFKHWPPCLRSSAPLSDSSVQ